MIQSDRINRLRGSYDNNVDVLHLAVGQPARVEGEGIPGGIELDFDVLDGKPCAVTVFGYIRNGWLENVETLSKIVSTHFAIPPERVAAVLRKVLINDRSDNRR